MIMSNLANDSKVLHTGFETHRQTGAVSVAIQPASTFRLDPAGNQKKDRRRYSAGGQKIY